ncbi:serine-threonine protein kinase [Streptomyces sp. NPDC021020]|uniref:serine-threonine protein kinase n=1 Tax=Streptomyces sp. NPDC021020 TaxID=3365109 RepID=UPI0037AE27AB
MAVKSVQPYWDLTFDADGDPDPEQRDALLAHAAEHTDLVLFSHGWNNDLSSACRLYDRFYAPFPGLLAAFPAVRPGYVGVHWPSMRFSDEPIADFPRTAVAAPGGDAGAARDIAVAADIAALKRVLPGHDTEADRIAELLRRQPDEPEALEEFAGLVRALTGAGPESAALAQDFAGPGEEGAGAALPALLTGKAEAICGELADAVAATVGPEGDAEALLGALGKKIWSGAHELLRQATYFAMKGRAGKVGKAGVGPFLGQLAERAPWTRVHLVGHSFGARLVSFALAGLPSAAHNVASVTLLQGAFSHSAFSPGGALDGMQHRVHGPIVAAHSRHDTALGILYPLASRLSGDDRSLLGDDRWGALGHDGFHGLPTAPALALAAALGKGFPPAGCVSVDASATVCHGGPPSGAHSDICHPDLARLMLRAGALVA